MLLGGCRAPGNPPRESRLVATGGVSVNQAFGGHLVDHRDGLPKGGRDVLGSPLSMAVRMSRRAPRSLVRSWRLWSRRLTFWRCAFSAES